MSNPCVVVKYTGSDDALSRQVILGELMAKGFVEVKWNWEPSEEEERAYAAGISSGNQLRLPGKNFIHPET